MMPDRWTPMLAASLLVLLAAACAGDSGPGPGPVAAPGSGALAAAEPDRSVECPGLVRVKYPFLSCVRDEAGNVVFDAEPEPITVSRMPDMDPFVESDDYWGH